MNNLEGCRAVPSVLIVMAACMAACFSVPTLLPSATALPGPLHLSGATSPDGKFNVDINWFSDDLGKNNTFSIRVWNASTGQEVYDGLSLDFSIMQGEKELIKSHLAEPVMPADTATYSYGADYAFSDAGSYTIKVSNINNSGESVDFPIQVTPEFPPGVSAMVVPVAAIGAILATSFVLARSRLLLQ